MAYWVLMFSCDKYLSKVEKESPFTNKTLSYFSMQEMNKGFPAKYKLPWYKLQNSFNQDEGKSMPQHTVHLCYI